MTLEELWETCVAEQIVSDGDAATRHLCKMAFMAGAGAMSVKVMDVCTESAEPFALKVDLIQRMAGYYAVESEKFVRVLVPNGEKNDSN